MGLVSFLGASKAPRFYHALQPKEKEFNMMNEKGFNSALKVISTTGDKFAQAVHEAGLFAIAQVNEHGNSGFGVRLLEAVGKKHDRQRIANWLMKFGKFGIKNGVLVYRSRKDITPANLEATLEQADALPYWELTPEKKLVETINYLSLLKAAVMKHKAAEAKIAEGKQVDELHLEVFADLEKLLDKYKQLPAATPAV